ncbi:polysaccharide biosynthesis protein [Enterococcus timonensis]|uniref:polysaccharide biosynthesis protein n=1 Tax=Enterococcus timonensis TaxID=1852364 RepID=UPI0008D93809|nr:nucleoside-diphosphate sugar epimerase/dehydratase [Enterococcus timonensis]
MNRKQKIASLVVIDAILIIIANVISDMFLDPFVHPGFQFMVKSVIAQIIAYWIFAALFKVFQRINRYTSLKELVAIFMATTSSFLVVYFALGFILETTFSRRYIFLSYLMTTFLIIGSRLTWRIINERKIHQNQLAPNAMRTIIVGAGAAGGVLARSINNSVNRNIDLVAFVDDDPNKKEIYFQGVKVVGTTNDLPALIEEYNIQMVTIAVPSIQPQEYERIISLVSPLKVKLNTLPFIEEIANGNISVSKLRDVDVVDVLGREEIKLDMEKISDDVNGKTILVTGAGGSIGSEITRQLMRFTPKRILLLGHGENSIYQIHRELTNNFKEKDTEFIPIIADVQDRERIFYLMEEYRPEIIYHAAAHKHVPMMQWNPTEAVKNNIYGTRNVAEAAKAIGAEKFVMISTDKAVNPPNVMGASKRIAEMIVTSMNEPNEANGTKFVAVRFGNVLGSRGSVIPLFKEQIAKGGPVTVTDFRMTRYFMTIPEASRLVLQAGTLARGGEIFILDMGEPVKIVDLAKKMIALSGYTEDEIKILETGIRPGEKLYETLLVDKEKNQKQVFDKIFIGSVHGFTRPEIRAFVEGLPKHDDQKLSEELIKFARESSK